VLKRIWSSIQRTSWTTCMRRWTTARRTREVRFAPELNRMKAIETWILFLRREANRCFPPRNGDDSYEHRVDKSGELRYQRVVDSR
jgi:hypothetical protein